MRRPTLFSTQARIALFGVLGMLVFPALLAAQTSQAGTSLGLTPEGKAVVAVLPLAGEETGMISRFERGIMEAIIALEKYLPVEVNAPGGEIPTDMPPVRSLAGGARYALTGGVYPGIRSGEYYLQLWLWDMAGSTMIYTDDLVYDDMDGAMESLPGLVEWLFSHIREVSIEEPPIAEGVMDPLVMVGVKAGLSPRWYTSSSELSSGAWALNPEGGVSGALRLSSLFSVQLEMLLTGDTLVYRGLGKVNSAHTMTNDTYTFLSLTIPLVVKVNLKAGPVRLSPLAGFYLTAPLGQASYRYSATGEEMSYSWSFSVPLGITAGLEGAVQYGPGKIVAGLRYSGDFGSITIDDDPAFFGSRRNDIPTTIKRSAVSLYLGYEFGFLEGKTLGRPKN
jgi:hypothetical protein